MECSISSINGESCFMSRRPVTASENCCNRSTGLQKMERNSAFNASQFFSVGFAEMSPLAASPCKAFERPITKASWSGWCFATHKSTIAVHPSGSANREVGSHGGSLTSPDRVTTVCGEETLGVVVTTGGWFWNLLGGILARTCSTLIPLLMSEPLLKKNEFLGAQGRTTSTLWNFAIRRDRASLSHCPLVPPFRAWEKPFPPRVPAHYHIWLYVRRPSILFMVLGITQHFVAPPMTSNVLLVCLVAYATATMITVADKYNFILLASKRNNLTFWNI